MGKYQGSKKVVREYFATLSDAVKDENATADSIAKVISEHTTPDYLFMGVYPFREQKGVKNAVDVFWAPLSKSLTRMQRRQDIFIAGTNDVKIDPTTGKDSSQDIWVMSMGHFMGLFDNDFMGVKATGKMISLRYAEFSQVVEGKISRTGMFVDLIGFMIQAGVNPLPPSTGQYFVYPGPINHDGLLFEDAPEQEGIDTVNLVNQMVEDLDQLNRSGAMGCPPEILALSWSKDMIWYGPGGIGASYTIPRYQMQHQLPFRNNLTDKKFNGHVARIAEGNFSCFFGWPNLSNRSIGGFLGMPAGGASADMQVVDVYCRDGNKLSENWVLIDLAYWLKQQGLDIFDRTSKITNPDFVNKK
ncbi:polyketide cyclase [Candidatus Epulonipiscium fishelsonii]|uniref:Polyketide cyclase n=1 Tax=Candidatus Epulonipiscium fishelsonii TaxID=77094 RepID=A0ACC8XHC3_9FIRM|nr:polyketide cyclase [Epulopiscium sp. SCG-D08WGA-EpuloA1]